MIGYLPAIHFIAGVVLVILGGYTFSQGNSDSAWPLTWLGLFNYGMFFVTGIYIGFMEDYDEQQ